MIWNTFLKTTWNLFQLYKYNKHNKDKIAVDTSHALSTEYICTYVYAIYVRLSVYVHAYIFFHNVLKHTSNNSSIIKEENKNLDNSIYLKF